MLYIFFSEIISKHSLIRVGNVKPLLSYPSRLNDRKSFYYICLFLLFIHFTHNPTALHCLANISPHLHQNVCLLEFMERERELVRNKYPLIQCNTKKCRD